MYHLVSLVFRINNICPPKFCYFLKFPVVMILELYNNSSWIFYLTYDYNQNVRLLPHCVHEHSQITYRKHILTQWEFLYINYSHQYWLNITSTHNLSICFPLTSVSFVTMYLYMWNHKDWEIVLYNTFLVFTKSWIYFVAIFGYCH